ncbi:hypothetical protein LAZ67_2006415 [Cordylochernes scorpioides]|uniref:DUF5641 domain-containing protein n=1 Tax=Cordylochernes scorpioides TaxID=51811 RepID=A0ABY6K5C4_9ARAC|nr:hypothetical protein LAZ67_2006415 [Cordylochernes scorpioides]
MSSARLLNYEELLTLLAQIEACINSRPLTFVSNDPNDLTALTPGHFLIGNAIRHDAESDYSTLNLRSRWDLIQPQRDYFWNRWSCEYLHQLQERRKWRTSHPDVNIGDLVMFKEQNKPLQWKLARIVQIFPGEDDHVRVVLLRTPKGLLKRPITKICPLPYRGLLNYEELLTLLAQIEACINSRPLTFVSNDPNDLTALTPGHFLIGNAIRHDAESDYSTLNLRSRWDLIQPQRDYFWNRWSCEYLHQLQERRKWRTSHPDVNIGDLVMFKEQNKPLQWKLARIVQIFPGEDDHVRVVLLRTPKGLLKRPITKICPLPYRG